MSSKPITDRSCGTRNPADDAAHSAPIAIRSLQANTALGGVVSASSRCIAVKPPPLVKSASTRPPLSASTPASARARW